MLDTSCCCCWEESDAMMEQAAEVINKERMKVRQLEKKLALRRAP